MAQTPNQSREGQHVEYTQALKPLLAGIVAVEDECKGAWQIATAIPSLLSCKLGGVALRSGADGSWELALFGDDKRLSASKRKNMLSDLDVLFEAAIDRDLLAIPDRSRKRRPQAIPDGFRTLGIGSMVVAPIRTPRSRIGMLLAGRERADGFNSEETLALQIISEHFALATENVRLQNQLENASRQLERLQDIERRYQFLYTNAPAMLHSIDRDGRLLSVSDYWLNVLGFEREEVIGRRSVEFLTEESRRRSVEQDIPEFIESGIILNREYTFVKKSGETVDVLLSAVAERDAAGNYARSLAVLNDITEQKRAAARVRQLQRELHHVSRLSAMGEMATGLAHELNQPLTAMMNYVRASRRMLDGKDGQAPDKIYEYMDKAIAQADRAGQIIRHLRDFVKTGEADRRLEDLNAVVQEASALALTDTAEMRITVEYDLAQGLPSALIDRVQIQQVVFNLVRNSVEALAGSDEKHIAIKTSRSANDAVEVTVSDTGPGLPAEVLEQLFRPFVTTKANGMGMGLSICRSIIDEHGGRLWATPGSNRGTTFRFTAPVAAEDEPGDG